MLAVMLACAMPLNFALADVLSPYSAGLGVGARLKGAPSTVQPYQRDPAPIYRPDCRFVYQRHSDPNEGWTTRRVRVCN